MDGQFGIRIENVMLVVPHTAAGMHGTAYCQFETVTCVPYEPSLIKAEMLSEKQKSFVNEYHQRVRETLWPLLDHDPRALRWLERKTLPIN